MIRKPKEKRPIKHKRQSKLDEEKAWIWQKQNIYQAKEMWTIMWVIARLWILCDETPKLLRCRYQSIMELTKYDSVTTKPCSWNFILPKTKSRNVETNLSKWFFFFLPNPKTINYLVQCRFLFSLWTIDVVFILFFNFVEAPIMLTL